MAFNPNIPQPTDRIKDSQSDLLGNFTQLAVIMDVNQGIYRLPAVVADPTTGASQYALYSKVSANTGIQEAYLRRPSSGDITEMTAKSVSTGAIVIGSFTLTNVGYTRLPSGILIKWCMVNNIPAGTTSFVFPANDANGRPIPLYTSFAIAQATPTTAFVATPLNVIFSLGTQAVAFNNSTNGLMANVLLVGF